MDFLLRKAKKEDILSLCSLENECFSCPWSERAFSESMDGSSVFFLCEQGGSVLGYIGAVFVLDECSITNICTKKEARGRGIGTSLLEALEGECNRRGAKEIFLEVRESNEAARHLYEKLGYSMLGTRVNFYSNPRENARIYKKVL